MVMGRVGVGALSISDRGKGREKEAGSATFTRGRKEGRGPRGESLVG
jgi:hypothetical protein